MEKRNQIEYYLQETQISQRIRTFLEKDERCLDYNLLMSLAKRA